MAEVTIHDAKTQLSKLIARVQAGEEITIVRGRERAPVARLLPPKPRRRVSEPGFLKGQIHVPDGALDPMTDEELKEWGLR